MTKAEAVKAVKENLYDGIVFVLPSFISSWISKTGRWMTHSCRWRLSGSRPTHSIPWMEIVSISMVDATHIGYRPISRARERQGSARSSIWRLSMMWNYTTTALQTALRKLHGNSRTNSRNHPFIRWEDTRTWTTDHLHSLNFTIAVDISAEY